MNGALCCLCTCASSDVNEDAHLGHPSDTSIMSSIGSTSGSETTNDAHYGHLNFAPLDNWADHKPAPIECLPADIYHIILGYLQPMDVLRLTSASKTLFNIPQSIWRRVLTDYLSRNRTKYKIKGTSEGAINVCCDKSRLIRRFVFPHLFLSSGSLDFQNIVSNKSPVISNIFFGCSFDINLTCTIEFRKPGFAPSAFSTTCRTSSCSSTNREFSRSRRPL
jgi:hypothetical protein